MIDKIISAAASIAAAAVTALINAIRKKLNVKLRVRVEEIAVVIEALYDGCGASAKLEAFKKLCKKRGLNVKKAVDYLEKFIIPMSKQINAYIGQDSNSEKKTEVTN